MGTGRIAKPGDEIGYTVTYLEMPERPRRPIPARPANQNIALLSAQDPPVAYFLYLYKCVGEAYEWTDWLLKPLEEVQEFVGNAEVSLYSLMLDGWPGGFFMLDASKEGACDLAYFGLVPQAVGRGLGNWFLGTAIDAGWEIDGTRKMTVNTNTLDHPRALGLYQKWGFRPVRQQAAKRILTRERIDKN